MDAVGRKTTEEVAAWERSIAPVWRVLERKGDTSAKGATLTKLEDGSVSSAGQRPEKDCYTVRGSNEGEAGDGGAAGGADGSRRCHKRGPGSRGERAICTCRNSRICETGHGPRAAGPGSAEAVNPSADFDQDGLGIAK